MKPIKISELKNMISNHIKEQDLNEVLSQETIDKIKDKIVGVVRGHEEKDTIPEIIPESGPTMSGEPREFPEEGDLMTQAAARPEPTDTGVGLVPGEVQRVNTGQESQPTGYVDKAEPGKFIVFDYNEVAGGGENLAHKALRMYDNPDTKRSMMDMWKQEGKKTAEVYVAKFEKLGDLSLDYVNGTAQFSEETDYSGDEQLSPNTENPYAEQPTPQVVDGDRGGIENYIKNSIDLNKVVYDIVRDIVSDNIWTNQARAVNDTINTVGVQENEYVDKIIHKEPIHMPTARMQTFDHSAGQQHSQMVKPMEESVNIHKHVDYLGGKKKEKPKDDSPHPFPMNMKVLAGVDSEYDKISTPEELKEAMQGKDSKAMLISENTEVRAWELEGKQYLTPVKYITTNKCYVPKEDKSLL